MIKVAVSKDRVFSLLHFLKEKQTTIILLENLKVIISQFASNPLMNL